MFAVTRHNAHREPFGIGIFGSRTVIAVAQLSALMRSRWTAVTDDTPLTIGQPVAGSKPCE
jgi:hypothetical protein